MKHELRQYQKECLKNLGTAYKQGFKRIMLKLPTGAGKTSIASKILENCYNSGKRALFICDRIELINQTSDRLLSDGIKHGVIQADHIRKNLNYNIQVCSIQTLARREKINADMIIIDEAHTLHKAHIDIIKENQNIPIIGLSATPFAKGLGKHFDKMIVGATTKQLIELGFLCKPKVYAPSEPDLEKIKVVAGDYDMQELEEKTNTPKLVGDIVEHWFKLGFGKPTIVFAVNIAHSKNIVAEFVKGGVNAVHIDAYTDNDDRKEIIESFKAGRIKVLSSVDILSKGFDYPGAEVAILARPTKSLSLYIQQAGRVLRINPETNKTDCTILDHSGNTMRHGFVTDDTPEDLDTGKKQENTPAEKKEKKVIEPVKCPHCSFIKTKVKCENCGHEDIPKNKVESAEGYLVEFDENSLPNKNSKSAKFVITQDKKNLYGQLKTLSRLKGWKAGRAYYLYKELCNEEPTEEIKNVGEQMVTEQVIKYITYLNIKKAKSKNYFTKR